MKIVAWNCRGLNDPYSLTVPYLVWIYRLKLPMFLFISETKMKFACAAARLSTINTTSAFGWDSDRSSGGLLVLGWSNDEIECLYSSKKFILCKMIDMNGSLKYVLFFYGEPQVENRKIIWEQLQWFLEEFKIVLVIGDFNQVESGSEKLGGLTQIRGIDAFLDWRFGSNVTEVPFSGPRFTWSNKREGNDLILERLDRAYITEEWFAHSPDGRIFHEPIVCSDHAVMTYHDQPRSTSSNRPYQIENWCLNFPKVKEIVKNSWKEDCQGSYMFQLIRKLGKLRSKLQYWCLENKKVWGINWKKITKDLQSTGMNISLIKEGEGYVKRIHLLIPEGQLCFRFWKQRMKANWVKFGDCPTPTMYRKVKQQQSQKEILTLRNGNDTWVEGQREVEEVILTSIKEVYNPVMPDNHGEDIDLLLRQLDIPLIRDEDWLWLDRDFSDSEIKKAMLNLHCSKSPGPDGFTVDFFKSYWHEVGQLVIDSVKQFLRTGNMLKEWNQSLLVLIPKVKVPELASQFRPISLCNTAYKCISKCLVNRLKPILPSLITENQHAFIPGRYMEDNILLSHELMHLINSRRGSNFTAIKIDMSKAYDRVDWLFLLKVLQAFGFSNH
ncbi:uncharacterized protein LOC110735811 [Chenopodium quinoa]|uniref:uncharacterized protein LOC110735811 n=1 Tax=Chenopodium quinoa TaxID=63459 RepID=UPI000B788711|nr:uncharacterized protein LOC110735811 [Chenopodium quinoa]